ncbi:peroxisomal acyl-coenzyme A oxidase 1-like [Saccoglossus kowalevskii]|uniref:Acyl-coenzyme A oxidase n=1 Tax=Saccoglossus kowalevskii TaxID=10224 RepID=A0ABM0GKQ1_SACKO|nr:PREDICTED: peroxisomal acyl-coenzyme A oxidase 1-like [Saccoglossus kowalevskii]
MSLKESSPIRVNPDLRKEREKASFNISELTYIIDRGEDKTNRRRYLVSLALNDPDFNETNMNFLSRDEQYSSVVRRSVHIVQKLRKMKLTDLKDQFIYKAAALRGHGSIFAIHDLMLIPMLQNFATDEQKKIFLSKALNYEITGTYLQTELGHGTFVRGLETTATYDPEHQEFVINSPTLTSTKWWPGMLGKSANFAVVMAQLYSKGKHCGLQSFLVPLRSFEDHRPLPGVTLGDIGPKFGAESNDNGFCRFDHVRIPRINMLSKYATISPSGIYSAPVSDKIIYGAMVLTRITLVAAAARVLSFGCTIAIRYSAVRRQTELTPGGEEPQIIYYQSQQLKLFPPLATAYAFLFAAHNIRDRCDQIQDDIIAGNMSSIQELHGLSSAMKGFSSLSATSWLETLRLSCGGHGYSHASGFPNLYTNATALVTVEGEYSVMMLQTARYLIKCISMATSGDKLPSLALYLTSPPPAKCSARSSTDFLNLDLLVDAYTHRAFRLVSVAGKTLQSKIVSGKPHHIAWNESHIELLKAAEVHSHYYVVKNYVNSVKQLTMSQPLKSVMISLCQLYALHGIQQSAGDFLQDGYMNGNQIAMATEQMLLLLDVIRPNAVALCDAFDVPDELLGSILGRYDGNVYENMYLWAKSSPLNKTEVHESYYQYLKPMLKGSKL